MEPRRSNWGPPSPKPNSGDVPVRNVRMPVCSSHSNCWTPSPRSLVIVIATGKKATRSLRFPTAMVCPGSDLNLATGALQDSWTSDPSEGIDAEMGIFASLRAGWFGGVSNARNAFNARETIHVTPSFYENPHPSVAVCNSAIGIHCQRRCRTLASSDPAMFRSASEPGRLCLSRSCRLLAGSLGCDEFHSIRGGFLQPGALFLPSSPARTTLAH